jgi:hypothetical protein
MKLSAEHRAAIRNCLMIMYSQLDLWESDHELESDADQIASAIEAVGMEEVQ